MKYFPIATFCAATLFSVTSFAQRDPFADYEERGEATSSVELEAETPQYEEEPTPLPKAQDTTPIVSQGPRLMLKEGTWVLRGTGLFGYAGTTNELLDGGRQKNNTMFMRLAPGVGYHIVDQLEIGGSIGYLGRSLSRDAGDRSTAHDVLTELRATYALPFSPAAAFVPGVGMGMYFGGSSRTLKVDQDGQEIDAKERTKTVGAALALYMMLKYQIGENWGLTGGLALNALFGSEKVKSLDTRLGSNSVYIGLPVEVHYSF